MRSLKYGKIGEDSKAALCQCDARSLSRLAVCKLLVTAAKDQVFGNFGLGVAERFRSHEFGLRLWLRDGPLPILQLVAFQVLAVKGDVSGGEVSQKGRCKGQRSGGMKRIKKANDQHDSTMYINDHICAVHIARRGRI